MLGGLAAGKDYLNAWYEGAGCKVFPFSEFNPLAPIRGFENQVSMFGKKCENHSPPQIQRFPMVLIYDKLHRKLLFSLHFKYVINTKLLFLPLRWRPLSTVLLPWHLLLFLALPPIQPPWECQLTVPSVLQVREVATSTKIIRASSVSNSMYA